VRPVKVVVLAGGILLALTAGSGADTVGAREQPQRVLFVGNSLTAANDLPALVEAIGRTSGGPVLDAEAITFNNFSLEDHWLRGDARRTVEAGGWHWVVLQQGPSALPESQAALREWTRRFDTAIRIAGARTALYMVWPARARTADFPGVSASYAAAARDVGGFLLRAGDAWRAAWAIDPSLALYGPDGFHPSELGSYLAALVIHQGLTGQAPLVPAPSLLVGPNREIRLDARTAETLARAAAAVVAVRPEGPGLRRGAP
jgi:hypothetical protein